MSRGITRILRKLEHNFELCPRALWTVPSHPCVVHSFLMQFLGFVSGPNLALLEQYVHYLYYELHSISSQLIIRGEIVSSRAKVSSDTHLHNFIYLLTRVSSYALGAQLESIEVFELRLLS